MEYFLAQNKQGRGKDGREKVVIISGNVQESLYNSPTHIVSLLEHAIPW